MCSYYVSFADEFGALFSVVASECAEAATSGCEMFFRMLIVNFEKQVGCDVVDNNLVTFLPGVVGGCLDFVDAFVGGRSAV